MTIAGNIIMFVASIIMVLIGLAKTKKQVITWQSIQLALMGIASACLGSIPGAIANGMGFTRNLLSYNNKLTKTIQIILCILAAVSTALFNNIGWIGILPLIATLSYTWCVTTKNLKLLKGVIAFTCVLWAIHDFSIQSYIGFIFNIFTIITCIIGILRKEEAPE